MKDEVVRLNIGGTKFCCWKSLLTRQNCLFSKLYQHKDFFSLCDEEGNLFFDRSPKLFEFILNCLRNCTYFIEFPEETEFPVKELIKEIEFFGLSKTLHIEVEIPPKPTKFEILKDYLSFLNLYFKNNGFQAYLKQNLNLIEDFLMVSAFLYLLVFLILKFFVMTGFLTTYKVFYPIYALLFMLSCFTLLNYILNFKIEYLIAFAIILFLWFYSSFIFTKIFFLLNEGVYWRWLTIMSPLIGLCIVGILIFTFMLISDFLNIGMNFKMNELFVASVPYSLLYSIIAIPSYLDGGYIQSYWAAFAPLSLDLVFGFFVYLAKKNPSNNLQDEQMKEVSGFLSLFFFVFLLGNWLNWISSWILFLPMDFMFFRGFYLIYYNLM
jgi:hypothetical protein